MLNEGGAHARTARSGQQGARARCALLGEIPIAMYHKCHSPSQLSPPQDHRAFPPSFAKSVDVIPRGAFIAVKSTSITIRPNLMAPTNNLTVAPPPKKMSNPKLSQQQQHDETIVPCTSMYPQEAST